MSRYVPMNYDPSNSILEGDVSKIRFQVINPGPRAIKPSSDKNVCSTERFNSNPKNSLNFSNFMGHKHILRQISPSSDTILKYGPL